MSAEQQERERELRWLETNVAAYFDQGGPDPLTDVADRIRALVALLRRTPEALPEQRIAEIDALAVQAIGALANVRRVLGGNPFGLTELAVATDSLREIRRMAERPSTGEGES